ncbi:TPA: hypothetical protein ACSPOR_004665 [Bacillus cereus]|uniref:hypothetical protein n=1 Tax=Bacillus cereus TaxID=1396 RepID=UPI000A9953B8|nr:hypothetical protein [Bacillus cereus]
MDYLAYPLIAQVDQNWSNSTFETESLNSWFTSIGMETDSVARMLAYLRFKNRGIDTCL